MLSSLEEGGQKVDGRISQKLEISMADVLERKEMREVLRLAGSGYNEMPSHTGQTETGAGPGVRISEWVRTGRKHVS